MKRIKVSPDPAFSDNETSAAVAPESGDTPSAAGQAQREQPAPSVSSSSSSLPAIQRGLRASRIVPVTDAEHAAEEARRKRHPEKDAGSAPPLAHFTDGLRRIRPEEAPARGGAAESQGPGRGCVGDSVSFSPGGAEGASLRIPSRPPPAMTNLDLSSSTTSVSSTSALPPLELEVTPLPSLPPTPSSPEGGRSKMSRDRESGKGDAADGDVESNLPVRGGGGSLVDGRPSKDGNPCEERMSSAATTTPTPTAEAAKAAEAVSVERNRSLGRRHAEELRERLNRTFSPQGVEITTVMICSTELPAHIAKQMSRRTLNACRAEEQRAIKRAGSQQVLTSQSITTAPAPTWHTNNGCGLYILFTYILA